MVAFSTKRAAERGLSSDAAARKNEGIFQRVHPSRAPASEEQWRLVKSYWEKYNDYCGRDKEHGLRAGEQISVLEVCNFLEFYVCGAQGQLTEYVTLNTIKSHLRHFKSMERRYGNNSLTREAMAKVYDWIEAVLRKKYPIQSHMKEKMHVNLEEFLEILNFLWLEDCDYIISPLERLQLSLFIMISAFTLGRPGSIVLANGREDAASALCYQDMDLCIVAPDHEEGDCTLLLGVRIRNHKGQRQNDSLWTDITLHDSDVARPVSQFIALALHDNAFEANITTADQILMVNPLRKFKKRVYQFRWKTEYLKKPVFRHPSGSIWNIQFIYALMTSLGLRMGFKFPLRPYSIRYGVSNSIEGRTTLDQRMKIMAHFNERMYGQAYMSKRIPVDLVSIFTNTPRLDKIIFVRTGHCRYRDSRAPQKCSASRLIDTLRDDKVLQELYTTKAELDATISTSELGSPSFKSHVSAMVAVRKQIGTRKEYLKRHLLAQERQEFFDRCDSLDINAQIEEQNDQNLSGTTEGPAMEEDSSQQASITRPSRLKVIERIKSDYPTNSIDPILVNRFLEYINDATWSDEAKRYKKKKKTEYRRALASQAKGSALVTDAKGMRAKRNYESAEGSSLEEDQTDYGTARPSEMDGEPAYQQAADICEQREKKIRLSLERVRKVEEEAQGVYARKIIRCQRRIKGKGRDRKLKMKDCVSSTPSAKPSDESNFPVVRLLDPIPDFSQRTVHFEFEDVKKILTEYVGLDIINCYQNSAQQAYTILIGDQGAGRRWENISEIVKIAARLDVQQRVSTSAKCVIEGADSLVEYFLRRAHYVERSSARKYKKQIWRNAGDVKETAGDDSPENTATV